MPDSHLPPSQKPGKSSLLWPAHLLRSHWLPFSIIFHHPHFQTPPFSHSVQCSTQVLIHALVTFCIPNKLVQWLQTIQNSAARITTRSNSNNHITSLLIRLHWLLVHHRIHYKIRPLTIKALHNLVPSYLPDLYHCPSKAFSLKLLYEHT